MIFGAVLVLIAVLILALGLAHHAIILLSLGKIRRAYVRMPQAGSGYLEAFAIYMALFLALAWVLHKYTSGALIWELLLLLLIPPAMIWILLRGSSFGEMRRGLGCTEVAARSLKFAGIAVTWPECRSLPQCCSASRFHWSIHWKNAFQPIPPDQLVGGPGTSSCSTHWHA